MFTKHFSPGWDIRRLSTNRGSAGGVEKEWNTVETVEGKLRPMGADKRVASEREVIFFTHRFYTRPTDIRVGDRIRKQDREFEVKSAVDVMEMGRLMQVDLVVVE